MSKTQPFCKINFSIKESTYLNWSPLIIKEYCCRICRKRSTIRIFYIRNILLSKKVLCSKLEERWMPEWIKGWYKRKSVKMLKEKQEPITKKKLMTKSTQKLVRKYLEKNYKIEEMRQNKSKLHLTISKSNFYFNNNKVKRMNLVSTCSEFATSKENWSGLKT